MNIQFQPDLGAAERRERKLRHTFRRLRLTLSVPTLVWFPAGPCAADRSRFVRSRKPEGA